MDETKTELLLIRPANDWVSDALLRPNPKMLFGPMWYEGELCILFADTGAGKSILAVQIGDAITKGGGGILPMTAEPQKVLYVDFELSDKQFQLRYTSDAGRHGFSGNFLRAEMNHYADISFKDAEEKIFCALRSAVEDGGVKILIVDNITFLARETEKSKDALPLMKRLQALKKEHDLSVLVLTHTPKLAAVRQIEGNDMQGSKMFHNFCDSAFAIGKSAKENGVRYLKQVKERNTEKQYGDDNIILCRLQKDESFLHFDLAGYGHETEHLAPRTKKENDEVDLAILEEKKKDPSLSNREIARRVETNDRRVQRTLARNSNSVTVNTSSCRTVAPVARVGAVALSQSDLDDACEMTATARHCE